MVRDHEFCSMYLLISISMLELLLLCDCGRYWAAVCCGTGSVMTAGLMLSEWCSKHSGWVDSSHPQSLVQGSVVVRSDLQHCTSESMGPYKRGFHVATVLLALLKWGLQNIINCPYKRG